jgi:hypothetical protein
MAARRATYGTATPATLRPFHSRAGHRPYHPALDLAVGQAQDRGREDSQGTRRYR